jgi:Spy/CpxP family protein refolding chaperone
MRGGGRGGAGGGGGARGAMNRVLDDQQFQLFSEALQKTRDDMSKLDEKLRAAEKELVQAVIAENYDEKVIRQKAEAVTKLQADMIVLRSQALAVVAPTLKPEQREELVNGRTGMGAMLLTSGFMGGGMMRGGAFGAGGGMGGPGMGNPAVRTIPARRNNPNSGPGPAGPDQPPKSN